MALGHEECIPADVDQNNAAAVQAFLASHRCDLAREPGSQDLDLAPLDEMLDELATAPLVRFVVPFLRVIVALLKDHHARLEEVALMARGAAYQPIEEDEDDGAGPTVFGIPVVLRHDYTADDVNAFVANLPAGLDADVVVSELVNAGYVARRSS